jgi:hypothetical protein
MVSLAQSFSRPSCGVASRRLRQIFMVATVMALLVVRGPIRAAEPVVLESSDRPATLVELFTSEGCSSCPPADEWLSRLKTNPALWGTYVPISLHVDYWNRLGWMDRFSSPEFTARQRRYAENGSGDSVYTPEVVLNGREWRGFFSGQPLPEAAAGVVGRLKITLRERGRAEVTFTPAGKAAARPTQVELALLGMNLESDVKRGENSARRLRHDFVVLQIITAKLTADGAQFTAVLTWNPSPLAEATALAGWVSNGNGQPPIQVVGGWLRPR